MKETPMKRIIPLACSLAVAMALTPMAMAQTRTQCQPGQKACEQQLDQRSQGNKAQQGKGQQHAQNNAGQKNAGQNNSGRSQQAHASQHRKPGVGDSARSAQKFQQAQRSRLSTPPRGQEYRVKDNYVVRVDSSTLKVLAVVGLLETVLNQ